VTRLGFAVNDGNLKKYESGVNNIKNSAEQAANSFRNMFAAFIGVSAIKSIADTADKMQSMEARVGMLPQTVGEAGDAFDTVASRASAARQSIDAYGNLYIKIQNAGKEFIKTQEEGLQITDTLAKALVVGGATAQEQSSAMLQFAQALGSGVLQGDELRAMAEASPQFMDELANAIGVPRSEIKKMGSDGKLTSKIIVDAVKKMGGVFEDRFKQMPITIGQATTMMGNKWDMFINRLNRKSGTVSKVANFMLDGFDYLEKKMYALVDWLGGPTQALKLFGIILAAAFAPFIISTFVGALMTILSPAGLIFAALVLVGLIIEDIYQYMTGGESITGDWIAEIENGSEAFKMLGVVAIGVLAGIALRMLATAATSATVWAINTAASVASFAASAIASVVATTTMIAGFVAMVASAMWAGAQMAVAWLIALGPIGLIIAAVAVLTALFFVFKDDIIKIFEDTWNSVSSGFMSMIEKIKAGWNAAKSFLGFGTTVTAQAAAGAATSAGGTGSTATAQQSVTINQTLPPGTTPETAAAAKAGTQQAMAATDNGQLARQMGQLQ